jgi:uncharacterized protein YndB with AHSA1/START domain
MAAIMLRSVDALRMASERARIKASPAKIFAAWTRPEFMARWWGPDGGLVLSTEADPHVGERVRVVFQTLDGLTHDCRDEYREVVPERKLVFMREWVATPEQRSLVAVDLRTLPGGAELVFTHTQFDDETTRDDHRRGWNSAFDKLDALLAQPAERMSHGTA